jgi:hypothetical protein
MTSTNERKPRRYRQSTGTKQLNSRHREDAMRHLLAHAEKYLLTPSGAVSDCIRRYFKLRPLL